MDARCWLLLAASACYTPAPDFGDGDPIDDTTVVDDTTAGTDTEVDTQTEDTDVPPVDDGALQVFLLGDGVSDAPVAEALAEHGFNVVQAGAYTAWNGTNPSLDDIDVVFFMQAAVWDAELAPAADQAIVDHIGVGGGLIRTEKAAFAAHGATNMQIDFGLPVQYNFDQEASAEWWAVERSHDLLRSLPGLWTEEASFTHVVATDSNTTVVAETARGIPLLSYNENNGGVYIHINHDVTSTAPNLSNEFKTLLRNAVEFAAPAQ